MPTFPVSIPQAEQPKAKELARAIAGRKSAILVIGRESFEVPETVCHLIANLLKIAEEATSLAILPELEELTTQEAAELLRVSRQYFVRLLEAGKIPSHRVGTHRRVYSKDLVEYKRQRDLRTSPIGVEGNQYSFLWE